MNWVSIGSDNGLSPIRHQASVVLTSAGLLSTGPLATNFSEFLIKTQNFSSTKMQRQISSAKYRSFFPGWDELTQSLRLSDAIRRQGTESTLAQVMACCLTAPSHYLNQCWLIITSVRSSDIHLRATSQKTPQPSITEIICKIKYLKFHSNLPGASELQYGRVCCCPVTPHLLTDSLPPADLCAVHGASLGCVTRERCM